MLKKKSSPLVHSQNMTSSLAQCFFDTKYNVFVGIINDLAVRNIPETSQDGSI